MRAVLRKKWSRYKTMNKSKNNLLKNLGLALSVLFVLSTVSPAEEVLSPQEMKSLERHLEIDLKGYFFTSATIFLPIRPPSSSTKSLQKEQADSFFLIVLTKGKNFSPTMVHIPIGINGIA